MTTNSQASNVTPEVEQLLDSLRRRIRGYVICEGLCLALFVAAVLFWLGFLIDFVPVKLGYYELPAWARLAILLGMIAAVGFVVYWWVVRRVVARISRTSLALLLERQHGQFKESLVTSVELSEQPGHAQSFDPDMLAQTGKLAHSHLSSVSAGKVLRGWPLWRNVTLAVVAVGSIVIFGVLASDALALWSSRLFGLSSDLWERKAYLEVVGFQDGPVKVGRGGGYVLVVRADTTRELVPEECTVYFQSDDGQRSWARMRREGQPRDGYQRYVLRGPPFKDMLADVHFYVIGEDFRTPTYDINVVDNPIVTKSNFVAKFPNYLLDERGHFAWDDDSRFPEGTDLTLKLTSSKPLQAVLLTDLASGETKTIPVGNAAPEAKNDPNAGATEVVLPLGVLRQKRAIAVRLHDTDGVIGPQARNFPIDIRPDAPPEVRDIRLLGIGDAITPSALVPLTAIIRDDYQIDRNWVEMVVYRSLKENRPGMEQVFELPLPLAPVDVKPSNPNEKQPEDGQPADGKRTTADADGKDKTKEQDQEKPPADPAATGDGTQRYAIDFLQQARLGKAGVTLAPGDAIELYIKSADKYDLAGAPHVGEGDRLSMEIVTPEELMVRLEIRQVGLRQDLSARAALVEFLRDSMRSIETNNLGAPTGGDSPAAPLPEAEADSSRQLRVETAMTESENASQTLLKLAESFEAIALELENNRIESVEGRKKKLRVDVAGELRRISTEMVPVFRQKVLALKAALEKPPERTEAAAQAADEAQRILTAIERVIRILDDMEGFNELVDRLRRLMEAKESVDRDTQKLRARDLD